MSTPKQGNFDEQQMYSDYQAFAQMHAAGYGQHGGFGEQYGQAHEMYGMSGAGGKQGYQEQTTEMIVPAGYTDGQMPHAIGTDQKHPL